MNRALITIGVCLSIAALGCGNSAQEEVIDDILSTGACTNSSDLAVVCDPGFADEIATCATDASGQGPATATCLVTETGVSEACAGCYGDVTQCVFDNCLSACVPPNQDSEPCLACRADNCDEAQDTCTGDLDTACE